MIAEEFLKQGVEGYSVRDIVDNLTDEEILNVIVEFAKYQVEKVVHQILDRVDYGVYQNDDGQEPYVHESNIFVDHSTIHNAYDLNDIK